MPQSSIRPHVAGERTSARDMRYFVVRTSTRLGLFVHLGLWHGVSLSHGVGCNIYSLSSFKFHPMCPYPWRTRVRGAGGVLNAQARSSDVDSIPPALPGRVSYEPATPNDEKTFAGRVYESVAATATSVLPSALTGSTESGSGSAR